MTMALRDYQQDLVDKTRQALKIHTCLLLRLATGGGKTTIGSYIASNAGKKGNTCWIVVHRQELVKQWSATLAKFQFPHYLICSKQLMANTAGLNFLNFKKTFIEQNTTVKIVMALTVVNQLDKSAKPNLLITDEAHHAPVGAWRTISDWAQFEEGQTRKGFKHIGLTATPIRADGEGLDQVYSEMIEGPSEKELTKKGVLVPIVHYGGKPIVTREQGKKLTQEELDEITENLGDAIYGDAVNEYATKSPHAKAAVFVTTVSESEKVSEKFCNAGFKFKPLHGGLDDEIRAQILHELKIGEIDGIVCINVVSEGFDMPELDVLFFLRLCKSLSWYLQAVGRVVRRSEGKKFAFVFDLVNNWLIHGFFDQERNWTLAGKTKKEMDDEAPALMLCEKCARPFDAAENYNPDTRVIKCPNPSCGNETVIEQQDKKEQKRIEDKRKVLDGETVVVNHEEEAESRRQADEYLKALAEKRRSEVNQARDTESLKAIANERGYKPGWEYKVASARARKEAAQKALRESLTEWMQLSGGSIHREFYINMSDVKQLSAAKATELKKKVDGKISELKSFDFDDFEG